ncbi:hypothetical protein [Cytobacillus sp. IB215665]|uniref:hypothetical protein n=1 Tax=Cytobacillus sp. IB215665 TaxID=3097357 RepID=UPI002A16A241|nr:hypothetical protein [Cytobacillus sp. IB215665]MDX8367164.1 hypothetical protein [Cytobacillus sp. IB215665]
MQNMQKYKVNGVKFFFEDLKMMKREDELIGCKTASKLNASAKAVFIDLHFEVNDLGCTSEDFKIKDAAKKSGLKSSTYYQGFNYLREHGYIEEVVVGYKSVYRIRNYALYNQSQEEQVTNSKIPFSYFRIPYILRGSTVLPDLVASSDSRGITLLLEWLNGLTRELSKRFEKVDEYALSRLFNKLKERLNRSAKRVRQFLETIKPVLNIEMNGVKERKPKADRVARVRKSITQVVCKSISVSFNESCVQINDDYNKVRENEAKMRKETLNKLYTLNVALKKRDKRDIETVYKQEVVKVAKTIVSDKSRYYFMVQTTQVALEEIEEYIKKTSKKINNIGALYRTKLRAAVEDWLSRRDIEYINDDQAVGSIDTNFFNEILTG